MSDPVVSCLMTVYDGERFVARAVRSVLEQTLRPIEVVCIDDGSSDRTPDILNELARSDARLIWRSRPNTGIAKACNEGLAICRAPLIAKMDADDVSLPDRFERQVKYLEHHPEVIALGGAWQMVDESERLLTTLNGPEDDASIQSLALRGHAPLTHSCAMMRKAALDRIGGYDTDFTYALDLDLWLRLGEIGQLANLAAPPILKFRLHERSISETKRHQQRDFARLACVRASERRGIPLVFDATEPWRPGSDRASKHQYALKYGWWAFNSGEKATAAFYARRAIAVLPYRAEGWKLLAAALFKEGKAA